uniref:Immunoglobulin V-set domain-containing protein n=1 Tax=Nothoprocta perdicaria TaxID=30464 RepID=A0A8C6Z7Z7_NOTPE
TQHSPWLLQLVLWLAKGDPVWHASGLHNVTDCTSSCRFFSLVPIYSLSLASTRTVFFKEMLPGGQHNVPFLLILVVSAVQGSKATIEEEFQSRFQSSEIQGDSLNLFIDQVSLNDSGTYYCAESDSQ